MMPRIGKSKECIMSSILKSASLLKLALLGDSIASGAAGLLMAGGGAAFANLLGLPPALLLNAGLFLLPYAAFVGLLAFRPVIPHGGAWLIVAVNALWSIESLALLALGWIQPTLLGTLFVPAQAIVVAGFAIAQVAGLRRQALAGI
jgi:hypothetical protein